jgi:hypothetical protein
MPDSHRKERLLSGTGRLTLQSTGVKLEQLAAANPTNESYDPVFDTCVKAFIRLLAALADAKEVS